MSDSSFATAKGAPGGVEDKADDDKGGVELPGAVPVVGKDELLLTLATGEIKLALAKSRGNVEAAAVVQVVGEETQDLGEETGQLPLAIATIDGLVGGAAGG